MLRLFLIFQRGGEVSSTIYDSFAVIGQGSATQFNIDQSFTTNY